VSVIHTPNPSSVVPTLTGVLAGGGGALTPADLGGLLAAFNDVTQKLQSSHDALRGEVARLTRELHEANEQVERSKRLAALGEVAAGIAHEVRNPLGSIRLNARMLEQDLAAQPQMQLAVKITAAARAVESIVSDVLHFAREIKLEKREIEPAALFEHALDCSLHEAQRVRGLDVVRSYVNRRLTSCHADPHLLQQVLVNVVQNAMQVMAELPGPHRLELDVERARVAIGSRTRVPATVLVVRDTGPGVPPEVVERMFNPFFTTRASGTGLGLSIVHRIVDAHGGLVRVANNAETSKRKASSDARGACVEIVLPLDDRFSHDSSKDTAETAGLRPRTFTASITTASESLA
jgi:signal transduction histidine kinase